MMENFQIVYNIVWRIEGPQFWWCHFKNQMNNYCCPLFKNSEILFIAATVNNLSAIKNGGIISVNSEYYTIQQNTFGKSRWTLYKVNQRMTYELYVILVREIISHSIHEWLGWRISRTKLSFLSAIDWWPTKSVRPSLSCLFNP